MADLVPVRVERVRSEVVTTLGELDRLETQIANHMVDAQESITSAMIVMIDVRDRELWRERTYADGTPVHANFTDWVSYFSEYLQHEHNLRVSESTMRNMLWMGSSLMTMGYSAYEAFGVPLSAWYKLTRHVVEAPNARNSLQRPKLRPEVDGYDPDNDEANTQLAENIVRQVVEGSNASDTNRWLMSLVGNTTTVIWMLGRDGDKVMLMAQGQGPGVPSGYAVCDIAEWDALPGWVQSSLVQLMDLPRSMSPESALDA